MKANELMLFDLIRRKKDGKVMTVVELRYAETIAAITQDDVYYGDMEDYHESEIDPIPLTPEILEKNGWKHDPSMERLIIDCKLFIDRERWMSWDSKYHCLNITIRDSKQLSQYNLKELRLDVPCTNVHELQHALRLCGIEKEITL